MQIKSVHKDNLQTTQAGMGDNGPTLDDLNAMHLDELGQLAAHWRAQASRGFKDAFGPAHVFESALRQRLAMDRPPAPIRPVPQQLQALPSWRDWLQRLFPAGR